MAIDGQIQVTVVYSPAARDVREISLVMALDSTVWQAVQASGLLRHFPELDQPGTAFGIWGRKSDQCQTLRTGDRVEIYRSLRVDPKIARRERFVKQGVRGAGLFDKKRGNVAATD